MQSTPRQRSLEGKLLLITGDNWTGRFPMEAQGEHRCLVLITVQTQGGKSPSLHPTGIIQAGAEGTQLRGTGSPPGFQHRKPHCSVLGKVPKIQQRGQRCEGSRARSSSYRCNYGPTGRAQLQNVWERLGGDKSQHPLSEFLWNPFLGVRQFSGREHKWKRLPGTTWSAARRRWPRRDSRPLGSGAPSALQQGGRAARRRAWAPRSRAVLPASRARGVASGGRRLSSWESGSETPGYGLPAARPASEERAYSARREGRGGGLGGGLEAPWAAEQRGCASPTARRPAPPPLPARPQGRPHTRPVRELKVPAGRLAEPSGQDPQAWAAFLWLLAGLRMRCSWAARGKRSPTPAPANYPGSGPRLMRPLLLEIRYWLPDPKRQSRAQRPMTPTCPPPQMLCLPQLAGP